MQCLREWTPQCRQVHIGGLESAWPPAISMAAGNSLALAAAWQLAMGTVLLCRCRALSCAATRLAPLPMCAAAQVAEEGWRCGAARRHHCGGARQRAVSVPCRLAWSRRWASWRVGGLTARSSAEQPLRGHQACNAACFNIVRRCASFLQSHSGGGARRPQLPAAHERHRDTHAPHGGRGAGGQRPAGDTLASDAPAPLPSAAWQQGSTQHAWQFCAGSAVHVFTGTPCCFHCCGCRARAQQCWIPARRCPACACWTRGRC